MTKPWEPQKTVDVIISDQEMPRMTGLELLKKVKAEFPKVPFVLVTAHSNFKVIRRGACAAHSDSDRRGI